MYKYKLKASNQFARDYKKSNLMLDQDLIYVVNKLLNGEKLEKKFRNHKLQGNYKKTER